MNRAARRLTMLVGFLCAAQAHAAGPESPETTARVLGRAGAAVASSSDLSALELDPAALARLGAQIMASVTAISRADTVTPLGMRSERNRAEASVLPFVAAAMPIGHHATLAAGVAKDADAQLRFETAPPGASSFSRLVVPLGIGVRLPGLFVGATARAERVQDVWGASGTAAAIVAPRAPIQLAVVVTTPAAGNAETPWVLRGGLRMAGGRVDGEIAGSWEGWSALPGHNDTGSIGAGLDIMLVPSWLTLRAGWSWAPASVEPTLLSPSSFDLDHHTLACGATVCTAGICLDLAFAHAFAATHAYSGEPAGRYEGHTDAVSLSLRLDLADFRHARSSPSSDERGH